MATPVRGVAVTTRSFRKSVSHPDGELLVDFDTEAGDVTRFVVQLECWVGGDTEIVARFDHTPNYEQGHDVREEGLHMDIYRDGRKVDVETDELPGPVEPGFGLNFAINYLRAHDESLIVRYHRWRNE